MNKKDINPNIGNGDLGVSINNGDACTDCQSSLSDSQQQELNNLKNSLFYSVMFKALGYSFDNIFVCENNVKVSELTSGWYSTEKAWGSKPAGKCSHGGASDNTSQLLVKGGINKDSATFVFSPHYNLHQAAADLSVMATIHYMEDFREAINDDDLFGRIIGTKFNEFISILIDTTGSMKDSIEAVKAYAENMVTQESNKSQNVMFYFTPFNDPEYGPVMLYKDAEKLKDYIGSLTADGGGDTPEKCFAALLETIRVVPPQTNVYIFTDASSKDTNLLSTIRDISLQKKLHINFMMSGENIKDDSESSMQDYKDLAMSTDGYYFLATTGSSMNKTAKIMTYSNWQTIFLTSNSWSPGSNMTQLIYIDDQTEQIEVSVSGNYVNAFLSVKDSSGKELAINETLALSTNQVLLYRIPVGERLTPWTIFFKSNSEIEGQISIRAQSALQASQTLYDESTLLPISGTRPPVNSSFQLIISCPDCSSVDKIQFGPCGGNLKTYTEISTIPSLNWWSISNLTMTSSNSIFCTMISGKTTAGSKFERILSDKIQTSTLQLTASLARPVINIGEDAEINYQVNNLGNTQDTVQLSVTSPDNVTFIYNDTYPIDANEVLNGSITVKINSKLPGNIDIEINAQSIELGSRQGNSLQLSLIVMDPNQDITAPVCSVVSDTASYCDEYSPTSCNSTNYNVVISFEDANSGVDHVSYPYGSWNISKNMFTGNTSNVAYTVEGTISCCYNTTFIIVDKSSLVTRCGVEVKFDNTGITSSTDSISSTDNSSGIKQTLSLLLLTVVFLSKVF
ncbi:hypothetical protein FO519_009415 [Halicephalobus sp. NKZ332]|nr:hypothetical protein FO519_009415 [Halicephalobus sp. NKZ332]